jgi:glycerate-2-kinase
VDGQSVKRAKANGCILEDALKNSDSNRFLEACGGLIRTGPTQSNLNDLFLMVQA